MTDSVLKQCLEKTKQMTEKEVREKCEKLGLYEPDNKKYEDSNFEIILPVNSEIQKRFPQEIDVTVESIPDYRNKIARTVVFTSSVAANSKYKNTSSRKYRRAKLRTKTK